MSEESNAERIWSAIYLQTALFLVLSHSILDAASSRASQDPWWQVLLAGVTPIWIGALWYIVGKERQK